MAIKPETTLADLIWGDNLKKEYVEVFSKASENRPDREKAQEVLDAMIHPEARRILDYLEENMGEGERDVTYSERPISQLLAYETSGEDKRFFFSDTAYMNGIYSSFKGLIEAAHPEYEWIPSEVGAISFRKI